MERSRRYLSLLAVLAVALLGISMVVTIPVGAQAPETPRRGGVLLAVIGADPPSLDPHQESTFANIQLVAPLYSLLLQIDPLNYPKIIGDVATEWKMSPDGLTYTFKLRQGIKFHDGSPLTSADVKATYEKIVSPPQGVASIRKEAYTSIERIEAPDPATVVFKLKFPSASLLSNLASPWNVIYPKKYLDKDPNPDYFIKDRPYLDGYKFYISPETSVRAAAIRSGRAYIEFRDLPNAEAEAIKKQLGDKVAVQQTPMVGQFGILINNTVKPFTDPRVRKAVTLGFDRYTGGKVLYTLTGLRDPGGLLRPGTEFALPPAELEKLPGFWRDAEKSRAEAKRLLAEAGYPNGFKVVLKNRNVKLPYQDLAVFAIQEWRKIGIEAENRPVETAAWFADLQGANFELMIGPTVEFMDDPDQFLNRYTTGAPQNYGRFSDPVVDDLFSRQARAIDPAERKKLVMQLQQRVIENVYYMPGLWWTRNVVHWVKVKNYVAPPSHYTNQKLQDVWLSEN
jgi:peptide/nickel transport system substrate-binding protein